MEEIKAYKLSDGSIFEDVEAAEKRQHLLDVVEKLSIIYKKRGHKIKCADDFACLVYNNRDAIMRALNNE
jgi:hypothetical protein